MLHATRDLDATLDARAWLLAPAACWCSYEATEHLPWFDVTTGLIEGWQRFEDDWRGDHPLLAPGRWAEALRRAGFDAVEPCPRAGSPAEVLGQHVHRRQVPGDAVARRRG